MATRRVLAGRVRSRRRPVAGGQCRPLAARCGGAGHLKTCGTNAPKERNGFRANRSPRTSVRRRILSRPSPRLRPSLSADRLGAMAARKSRRTGVVTGRRFPWPLQPASLVLLHLFVPRQSRCHDPAFDRRCKSSRNLTISPSSPSTCHVPVGTVVIGAADTGRCDVPLPPSLCRRWRRAGKVPPLTSRKEHPYVSASGLGLDRASQQARARGCRVAWSPRSCQHRPCPLGCVPPRHVSFSPRCSPCRSPVWLPGPSSRASHCSWRPSPSGSWPT